MKRSLNVQEVLKTLAAAPPVEENVPLPLRLSVLFSLFLYT